MYSFKNDYSEGAHPALLQALAKASMEQNAGYGLDIHSQNAVSLLKKHICREDADIHFLEGGTQVNLTAISSFLRPHEAAIAAVTGHIAVHESGSIEATGHKVCTVSGVNGKLTPQDILQVLQENPNEHTVKPKLVYISDSTETGTIYSKAELTALSECCKTHKLWLYMDGARLGSALTAISNDLTMADIAQLTDAFYIGGTKNGALFGEALVICNDALKDDFRYMIKQEGAMLAKGMALGAQFEALFTNNLYYDLAAHANKMAQLLKDAIHGAGFRFLAESPTNQLFPILPNSLIEKLAKKYDFEIWKCVDKSEQAIRLVTSWATPESAVEEFIHNFETML